MSVPLLVQHTGGCPLRFTGHSDAAKRVSDTAKLHYIAQGWDAINKWMAFKLGDGDSDMSLYDRKADAIRLQRGDEFQYMYLPLHPGGMSVCEAEIMLKFHRQAYSSGHRLIDPDKRNGGRDILPRIGTSEVLSQIRNLR